MNQKRRIIALNAALRDVIEFRQQEVDEEGFPIGATAGAVGGVGAVGGAGYALYRRGAQMPGDAGAGARGVFNNMRAGVTGYGQDIAGMRERIQPNIDRATGAVSGAAGRVRGIATDIGGRAQSAYGTASSFTKEHAGRIGRYAQGLQGEAKQALSRRGSMKVLENLKALGKGIRQIRYSAGNRGVIALNSELRDILHLD